MIGYIISFIAGSFVGMFVMALAAIAKQSDKKTEELMKNYNEDSKQLELF